MSRRLSHPKAGIADPRRPFLNIRSSRRPQLPYLRSVTTTDATPRASGSLKDRILDAALDELRALDPVALLHAIGARTIAGRAGAGSPASINQHYGSLAGLADAVMARVFDTSHLNVPRITELISHIEDSALPLTVAFAMHEAEFNRLTTDDEFKLRMGLWALGGPTVADRYRDYLHDLTTHLEGATAALFGSWGRELRPPADVATYLAIKLALINGITVRHLTDPDDRWLHHFQRATVALDLVLLRVPSDRHDLDARLTEMNYYPLEQRARGTERRSRPTVARILHAANDLFSTRGYDATGIEQIARSADTSLSTLKRYYPSKRDLAVALFQLQAADEPALLPRDQKGGATAADLRAHLRALVDFARGRSAVTSAYIGHLADPATDPDDVLLARTRSHLSTPDDAAAEARAAALVLTTLRRALTHPADSSAEVTTHVLDLISH